MEFLAEYGVFLAKTFTLVIAILVVVGGIIALSASGKGASSGSIKIKHVNAMLKKMTAGIEDAVLSKDEVKAQKKAEAKKDKEDKKTSKKNKDAIPEFKKRVYVLDFDGDIKASAVEHMKQEITAVLTMARKEDEVVLRLESGGGMVHGYGLASSQLQRITDKNIPLTICVDKVAASGGYMMACIADRIVAAPFAILGSIGVVAQVPNFHRLLQKNDVDFEMFTAGEYKRTVTMFGENTDKGREKFNQDLEDTHVLFKEFVGEHRTQVNLKEVANGDVWYGKRALDNHLIDQIITSDEYVTNACNDADVYEVSFKQTKSLPEKLGLAAQAGVESGITKMLTELNLTRFMR